MKAIILHEHGLATNLKIEQVAEPDVIQEDYVLISHAAIAVNHSDLQYRNGTKEITEFPVILGGEAMGYVEEVGKNVKHLKRGDRVCYATTKFGAYCEQRIIHNRHLINVPLDITDIQCAALLSKSLTAHYLTRRVIPIAKRHTALVHAGAGAVGQVLIQWLKILGAKVIATVGREQKIEIAKEVGADEVVLHTDPNWSDAVLDLTQGMGVDVVYDFIGKDTFAGSLKCTRIGGLVACVGDVSGAIPEFSLETIAQRCLFITKPDLMTYKKNRVELVMSAFDGFQLFLQRTVNLRIYTYKFDEVARAHNELESRVIAGSSVLTID